MVCVVACAFKFGHIYLIDLPVQPTSLGIGQSRQYTW